LTQFRPVGRQLLPNAVTSELVPTTKDLAAAWVNIAMANWVRLLLGFAYILLFGGCLFMVDGGWRSYRQYLESTHWPAVEARVVECSIHGSSYYSSFYHTAGDSSNVRCKLEYTADGAAREATFEVGEPIFTSKKQIYPVPKVTVGPPSQGVTAFIPIYPNKRPTVPKPSRTSRRASLVVSNLPASQSAITRLENR
jgi:hypothetical protein